jgi:hypothetical protein
MNSKTKTKSKGETGFRNGNLFCFNCGDSYNMNLPQPVNMASLMMKEFAKNHKGCLKTWSEPVADQTTTIQERMIFWLGSGERGMGSEAMFEKISGYKLKGYTYHPCDPDDFKRCYKLLKIIPEWKSELHKLKELSPVWEKLVDNWDKLTEYYENMLEVKKPNGMYEFMRDLGC